MEIERLHSTSKMEHYKADTSKPTGRHNVSTYFPKDPNCEVCKLTKATRAPCRNRPEAREDRFRLPQKKLRCYSGGSERSHEENECRLQHRFAVVVHDPNSHWIQSYPTKNETAQETMKKLATVLAARSETRYMVHTANSLEFIRACED